MKDVGTVAAVGHFGSAGQKDSKCDGPDVRHEHCVLSRYSRGDGHKGESMMRWPHGLIDAKMATRTGRLGDGHKGRSDMEMATRAC